MPMPRRALPPAALAAAAALLACAACSKPAPPDTDRPPEPQAAASELHAPIDRAKAADAQVEDAAAKQRAAIDAQAGD
jgi:hypothetical protein